MLCADVQVEKTSTKQIVPGEEATYTLKVTDNGPGKAENVTVSDPLPKGESFVSASSGCAASDGKVTCNIASLAVGASQTFDVTVKVSGGAKCSDLTNTATVTDAVPDPNLGNNSSTVRNCAAKADIEITKGPSAVQIAPDGQVMYTLVVKNKGPSDDDDVTVSDPLASGLSLQSAQPSQGSCSTAGGKVLCHLGRLAAGGAAQVLVTTNATVSSGCIENAAEAFGDGFDPNQADNRDAAKVCVTPKQAPRFDLAIKKTAKPTHILAGGKVKYTLLVTNNGPDTAPGVKVADTFNRIGRVISVKSTVGSCTKSLPTACSLGDMAKGATVTITVVVEPLSVGGNQRNVATVTGEGNDTNPDNNESAAKIKVTPRLKIIKKADRKSVEAGGIVHYTIRVTNLAKKIAVEDVRTCDQMPSGLAFVSATPKAKLAKGTPCWSAKVIKGGKSRVYHVTAKALHGAKRALRNVATTQARGGGAGRAVAAVTVRPEPVKPTPVTG